MLDPNQYSWGENYAGSSGLMSVSPELNPVQRARSGTVICTKDEASSKFSVAVLFFAYLFWKTKFNFKCIIFMDLANWDACDLFYVLCNVLISSLFFLFILSIHSSIHLLYLYTNIFSSVSSKYISNQGLLWFSLHALSFPLHFFF